MSDVRIHPPGSFAALRAELDEALDRATRLGFELREARLLAANADGECDTAQAEAAHLRRLVVDAERDRDLLLEAAEDVCRRIRPGGDDSCVRRLMDVADVVRSRVPGRGE